MFDAYLDSIIYKSKNIHQYLNEYEKKHGTKLPLACKYFNTNGRTYNLRQPSLIILFIVSQSPPSDVVDYLPAIKLLLRSQRLGLITAHLARHEHPRQRRPSCALAFEFNLVIR